jgi:AcrR family transcriptional regulator
VATNTTVERILDGTLSALARRGHRKLSMSDICEHAGISRGTLYRYFNSKEDVLGALGKHVEEGVQDRLSAAIAEQPAPEHRLGVVLQVVIESQRLQPETARLLEVEPGFVLDYMRNVFPQFTKHIADALAPAAQHIPAVRDKVLTTRQLAELTLRIGLSSFFVPAPDVKDLPKRLERLAGIEVPKAKPEKRRSGPARVRKAG